MAKYGSPSVVVLVDGVNLTPALTETVTQSQEALTEKTDPINSGTEEHTPTGKVRGTLALGGGIFDEAVDTLHAGIAGSGVGVSRTVCIAIEGQTLGRHFTGYAGAYGLTYAVVASNGSLTKANVTHQVSGQVDDGVILCTHAAHTADWTAAFDDAVDAADDAQAERIDIVSSSIESGATSIIVTKKAHHLVTGDHVAIFGHTSVVPDLNDDTNPNVFPGGIHVTVIDATSFSIPVDVTDAGLGGYCVVVSRERGGVGYLQVTAGSGFTNFVGTIQHNVDATNSGGWSDLVTFADTTTDYSTAQRVATATTTTQVHRYLRFNGNVTGSGSLTVFAGFARG